MKRAINPAAVVGFGLAAVFAVTEGWTLQEFSWSTWLAGLLFAWACVATGAVQAVLTARRRKASFEQHLPFLRAIHPSLFVLGVAVVIVPVAFVAWYVYSMLFFFYGLLLSFFAEMEPHELFGRNGFINSDFFTPVAYLVAMFWPMAAGVLVASWWSLLRNDPWKRIVLPAHSEVVRVHVFVVLMPFLALGAWALFGEAYHSVAIVALMALFYLLPSKRPEEEPADDVSSSPPPGPRTA